MPSASFQCSRLIWSGMSSPVEKLPGRSEIDTIASSGKMVMQISAISPACAATTRQRCLPPVTMAMASDSSLDVPVDAGELEVGEGQQGHQQEDHRRDGG